MLALLVLLILALAAGALGGLVGTGSSLILLPVLVVLDGPRVVVPVMAIARNGFRRRENKLILSARMSS